MKIQLVVQNVLGEFRTKIQEVTEDEVDQLDSFIRQNLEYFSFNDESGQEIIFKKDLISNSLIKIVKFD